MSDAIPCSSGCKRTVAGVDEAQRAGWEHMPVSGRWRCPQCWRELWQVNGRPTQAPDAPLAAPEHRGNAG